MSEQRFCEQRFCERYFCGLPLENGVCRVQDNHDKLDKKYAYEINKLWDDAIIAAFIEVKNGKKEN